ncbi:glycosyltransferase family 4 protein [Kiritimatiella glycovorans]|uniref:Glycosyl transferase, group 1 n=1 Tax=Kiritimatiella glycovorans TaxID=1307763 RepID=A0A0G3EGD2_9BACT|nr:glycosyltransferase family 4 protein [Kiritimatiella glycovorans]AKJ65526.1 Glycosyl transferase, group 1 [Kiritimatiella glycovorans]
MPKILILQPYLTPYRVGLFDALAAVDRVDVLVVRYSRPEVRRQWNVHTGSGFEQKRIRSLVVSAGYESNKVYTNVFHWLWILLRWRPDVVVACPANEGVIAAALKKLLRYRLIFWTEQTPFTAGSAALLKRQRFFYRHSDRYLVPGRLSAQYVRERCGAREEQIYYAPNSVDDDTYHIDQSRFDRKHGESPLKFMFCGSLIERKGFDLLKEAFRRLARECDLPAFECHVAGTGPLEKEPIDNIIYHGNCAQIECARIMRDCHVFVLPSRRDCNPLTVIEAAKCGNAMLLSDAVGNYPEFTLSDEWVFESGSVDALEKALRWVLTRSGSDIKAAAEYARRVAGEISHEATAREFVRAAGK